MQAPWRASNPRRRHQRRCRGALAQADAIIDFTAPAASVALAAQDRRDKGLIHIIGTTGCQPDDDAAIAAARQRPARASSSRAISALAVNLLAALVEKAAAALPDFDIEILEMHHSQKVDAPSGTALMLGEAAAEGREIALESHSVRVRDGHTGPREAGIDRLCHPARRAMSSGSIR